MTPEQGDTIIASLDAIRVSVELQALTMQWVFMVALVCMFALIVVMLARR